MPEISVIMPVYNCESFIKESVDSILGQSFTNYEFIIIDDASTDRTVEIIQEYDDSRIQLIIKPANTGYTDSLNMAIKLAKGRYIARMDGDDVSLAHRLAVQYEYLEKNPSTMIVGSHYKVLGTDYVVKLPVSSHAVEMVALMHVPVAHPTVMMRKELFTTHKLYYDKNFEPAEDYDLWCRVLKFGKIENVDEVLLYYRHHEQQISKLKYEKLLKIAVSTRLSQLQKLLSFPNKRYDFLFAIDVLTWNLKKLERQDLKKIKCLMDDLLKNNKRKKVFQEEILHQYLQERWNHYKKMYPFSDVADIPLLLSVPSNNLTIFGTRFRMGKLLRITGLKKLIAP